MAIVENCPGRICAKNIPKMNQIQIQFLQEAEPMKKYVLHEEEEDPI